MTGPLSAVGVVQLWLDMAAAGLLLPRLPLAAPQLPAPPLRPGESMWPVLTPLISIGKVVILRVIYYYLFNK